MTVLSEDSNIVEERKKLNREVETFRNAQKIIKRDPEYFIYFNKVYLNIFYKPQKIKKISNMHNNKKNKKKNKN